MGENEALFREVNERVRTLNEAFPPALHTSWICECSNTGCFERVELTPAEYAAVRTHSARFLVYPDNSHVVPEEDWIVEQHDRYWVVEKFGEAGRVADARAARTD